MSTVPVTRSQLRNRAALRAVTETKPAKRVIKEEVIDAAISRGEAIPNEVFSIESPRSSELWYDKPLNESVEFTHCRYTPCTESNPNNFASEGYRLRCQERDIKVLICISMYAEEGKELDFTLRQGICKNIKNFARPGMGAKPLTWENVAVVVVSDGRTKASRSTLDYAQEHGFFDAGLMEEYSYGKDVKLHLFEYSPQFSRKNNGKNYYDPVQVMFAIKEKNGGKLDSHYWFFNAFAESIKPEYTFLLDVGTMPLPHSIVRLYTSMETDKQIGGCCGEIAVSKPNYCNWTIAAQHFEYKVSNFMGKAMESLFGYITVLPGAFSAYRYEAIRGQPLEQYFYSIDHLLSPFKANMYLAEDRILCLELIAKHDSNWLLRYESNARAVTDVPENLVSLIRQRRRWLNGSFFAQLYAVRHFYRVWTESGHSGIRCLFLSMEFMYFTIQTILSWLSVGTFYVAFRLLVNQFFDNSLDDNGLPYGNPLLKDICGTNCSLIGDLLQFFYILMLVIQVIVGLRNKPEHVSYIHKSCSIAFGFINFLMIAMVVYLVGFSSTVPQLITYVGLGIFFSFLIGAVLHMEVISVIFTAVQYFFFLPTYINIFTVYSLCNTHDVSWGTKGIETVHEANVDAAAAGSGGGRKASREIRALLRREAEQKAIEAKKQQEQRKSRFETYSSHLLIFWLACNIGFVVLIGLLTEQESGALILTYGLLGAAAFQVGFQLIGSVLFLVQYYLRKTMLALKVLFKFICCIKDKEEEESRRKVARSKRYSDYDERRKSAAAREHRHRVSSGITFDKDFRRGGSISAV